MRALAGRPATTTSCKNIFFEGSGGAQPLFALHFDAWAERGTENQPVSCFSHDLSMT
jgi:hypothetical protein